MISLAKLSSMFLAEVRARRLYTSLSAEERAIYEAVVPQAVPTQAAPANTSPVDDEDDTQDSSVVDSKGEDTNELLHKLI
jgi:hypothetical protein